MKKIIRGGGNNNAIRNKQIQKRNAANLKKQSQADKLDVKNDLKEARSELAETGVGSKSQKKKKTDKAEKKQDKVTLTKTEEAQEPEALDTPTTDEPVVAEEKAPEAPKEKSAAEQFTDFHGQSADLLGADVVTKVFNDATRQLEKSPSSGPVSAEVVIAASVQRHAKNEIRKELGNPKANLKDAKKAAKTNKKVAGLLGLVESSEKFLKKNKAEQSEAGVEKANANGDVAADGVQEEGAILADGTPVQNPNGRNVNAEPATSDVFADAKGGAAKAGEAQDGGEPPVSTQSPVERAQRAAEHAKQMEEIRNIYQQMWKSMMEGMAERHKIMMETMNSINDIFRNIHNNRQASMNRQHGNFMNLVTEVGADKW